MTFAQETFLPSLENRDCANSYWVDRILSSNNTHDQLECERNLRGELFHPHVNPTTVQGPIENVNGNLNCMKFV